MQPEPVLSILIATHNHEKFIAALLDSVLIQKMDFSSEIIICDDASADTTREILLNYQKLYPEKITLILNKNNEGINRVSRRLFEAGKGKYLCTLDGDDRWIYENKLQVQVDFLEQSPDYSACFHDAEIISSTHEDESANIMAKEQSHREYRYYSQFNQYKSDFYPWDLLMRNIIPTASIVMRRFDIPSFFKQYDDAVLSLGWIMELFVIKNSKFKFINQVWSVYNDHPQGVSKAVSRIKFIESNIVYLKSLVRGDYYKYMLKDVYQAIVKEYTIWLHTEDAMKMPATDYKFYCSEFKKWAKLSAKAHVTYFMNTYKSKNKK